MKKILTIAILMFAKTAFAATPVTCTALAALGYDYLYFGYTQTGGSSGADHFTIAGSNDAINWTNVGGTWPTCGNGSPCLVNAPSPVCYNDNMYLLLAEANDSNLNSTKQDIGVLNTDLTVTTLLTFDWASLGSVNTIFAGNWKRVSGSTNCFDTPVDRTGGFFTFSTYTACASLTPTAVSITSGPTLLTTTGSTGYDPQVIQQGATCNLIQTQINAALTISTPSLSTGSCPNGPFTFQFSGLTPGSPLSPQGTGRYEGPQYLQTNIAGGWNFYFENSTPKAMYYANCTPVLLASCVIGTSQPWVTDRQYQHGEVLRMTSTPLPSTTVKGGTLKGGTWQ